MVKIYTRFRPVFESVGTKTAKKTIPFGAGRGPITRQPDNAMNQSELKLGAGAKHRREFLANHKA